MKQVTPAKSGQRGTLRICDVPKEIPIGEVLRKADLIAFGGASVAPSSSPTTVAWDRIKGSSTSGH